MRVAIDAMGGDAGPAAVASGVAAFLREDRETDVVLVGREDVLIPYLEAERIAGHERLRVHHASEVIEMGDKIASVRRKRDASVSKAVELVRDGEADGVVCVGNTLAAVVVSTLRLRLIEGVHRAGIAVPLPNMEGGSTIAIDMGANTMAKPEHLADYAVMASIYACEVLGVDDPRVGLLNVGEELGKGNGLLRESYELLEQAPVHFIGNVEGGDLFSGTCEIVVCDGFVGNVVLKASEAAAELFGALIRQELGRSLTRKVGGILSMGAFRSFKRRTDYAEWGGAILLGVNGVVIIGHGKSDSRAVANAVRLARDAARCRVNEKIRSRLAEFASQTAG
jgi:glycerol-3-phosphate acyltransferase PlsX